MIFYFQAFKDTTLLPLKMITVFLNIVFAFRHWENSGSSSRYPSWPKVQTCEWEFGNLDRLFLIKHMGLGGWGSR